MCCLQPRHESLSRLRWLKKGMSMFWLFSQKFISSVFTFLMTVFHTRPTMHPRVTNYLLFFEIVHRALSFRDFPLTIYPLHYYLNISQECDVTYVYSGSGLGIQYITCLLKIPIIVYHLVWTIAGWGNVCDTIVWVYVSKSSLLQTSLHKNLQCILLFMNGLCVFYFQTRWAGAVDV